MADNKIEILTSNAKQVINDYVLGTDTDFQKVENAIQELAENDISTLNWNSLENYPDRSHDYQFSYNNSDGTINIWDTESESYLSPSEFLLSEHSDRQMACDQYAQHRLQFLENTPEALRDCVSNIFQTLKDYHLDVTILSVPNKTGSLDGKDFFAFDVSGGREQIFHSQTGTSIGLKEFQETLEQLQFWDHEEDSTSDERINRILDAAADNPARLRMEVNFLFDDKIQPNGVDFDENASITWTIRGNHETETFILTRDPDTHEITAYEANHGVLNIEQLQEEASRIGVADVSLSNRVTSDEYTQLDHMQTMEKASAKATISAVTMERGLRGMGSLTWHMHGTNGQEDFSLDGNRDGSPIIRDKAGKEYDIDSMYNKLEDIGYFKTADPAPVDMYALPAREELPTYNSLFNFFPPEVRKNMDADEVKEIRASNPYYGIVDGIDMTRKTIPIHVDNAMESQDNDQDNMTEAANSKDNSESVVNGEEVHEIPESDVLETAEISSADEDVTADFEISQSRDKPESDSGAMPESLDVQDRQEELLIGSVGEDHSDSDSFSTADAKNDTFEPTTDDATLERGESQAESPTIGSENANSFHEEYKAQFSDCLNAANALDDVLSQAIEDVFSDENLGYMDIVNAAADAITDHYNSDTPYSEAAESSADLVYEVTDLDGKPMDNMDTMAEKLQQNGLSAEHVDHLYELASDRYVSPEEPFEQPDPYEGFMDLDSGVTDSVDRVDMSQSSSVDAQQKLDFYEPNQFLDQMSNDLDSYVQAIEHAENIGTDVPDTALSDIVGSSFSVDSLKSAIDLIEAEVKSTADDDRDAQETMDTDPVLSEDIPESSIEPEVDDSLDADEWRRYL